MPWQSGDTLTSAKLNWRTGLFLSALDPAFSADSSGALDSGTTLQAMLNTIAAAGGGTLFLPEGAYRTISRLTLGNNTKVTGVGPSSILSSGITNLGAQVGLLHASNVSNIEIASLQVQSGGSSNLISFHGCNKAVVQGCWLINDNNNTANVACVAVYDDGTASAGTASDFVIANNVMQPSNIAVIAQGDGTGPYRLSRINVANNVIDCSKMSGAGDGVLKMDLHVRDFVIANNTIDGFGLPSDGIIVEEGITNGQIVNNTLRRIANDGIVLGQGQTNLPIVNVNINGNVVEDCRHGVNVTHTISTYTGILVANNSLHSLSGNGIRNSTGTVVDLVLANNIIENHKSYGIYIATPDAFVIGNTVRSTTQDVDTNSVRLDATATSTKLYHNRLLSTSDSDVTVSNGVALAQIDARDNIGYRSENSGTATIANSNISVAVQHGLHITPSISNVAILPFESWGNATQFWVDGVGASQFSLYVDQDPGKDLTFGWQVIRR